MSDLEQQRRDLKPDSGMLVARGNGNEALTGELRALAEDKEAWLVAEKVHEWARNPEGGTWFTKWKLNLTPGQMSIVRRGCELGIFKKDEAKEYWKHTRLTWRWLLTALALRDEWHKSPEAQRIRDEIMPKTREREITG